MRMLDTSSSLNNCATWNLRRFIICVVCLSKKARQRNLIKNGQRTRIFEGGISYRKPTARRHLIIIISDFKFALVSRLKADLTSHILYSY